MASVRQTREEKRVFRKKRALAGVSATMLAVGLAWAAAPQARAGTVFYEVAFQASNTDLAQVGVENHGDWNLQVMPGSSPATTFDQGNNLSDRPSGIEVAYAQAGTGDLITFGPDGLTNTGIPVQPGTSPSISGFEDGGYVVAFQEAGGEVVTLIDDGFETDWGVAASGTNPSVTAFEFGTYEVAFQTTFGNLETTGTFDNHGAWALGMMAGTSPAVTTNANGNGYEVAFEANTGNLWTVAFGASGGTNMNLGMMRGTSPAITDQADGVGYEIAFQANTGDLWTVGADNHDNWKLGMMAGTNPSIIIGPGGDQYEVAFEANTGQVWTVGEDDHDAWTADSAVASGTSPSIGAG